MNSCDRTNELSASSCSREISARRKFPPIERRGRPSSRPSSLVSFVDIVDTVKIPADAPCISRDTYTLRISRVRFLTLSKFLSPSSARQVMFFNNLYIQLSGNSRPTHRHGGSYRIARPCATRLIERTLIRVSIKQTCDRIYFPRDDTRAGD